MIGWLLYTALECVLLVIFLQFAWKEEWDFEEVFKGAIFTILASVAISIVFNILFDCELSLFRFVIEFFCNFVVAVFIFNETLATDFKRVVSVVLGFLVIHISLALFFHLLACL